MGEKIKSSNLCNPDKWTPEEVVKYQRRRKRELTSVYIMRDLPSDKPWHRAYYLNSRLGIWDNNPLEEEIIKLVEENCKPRALIVLEQEIIKLY